MSEPSPLFPGFASPPNREPTPEETWLAGLRRKYRSAPQVIAERGYGSLRNWTIFKRFVVGLRAAIVLWKRDQEDDYRTLTKVVWDAAGSMPEGGCLIDFNERSQRCHLRNGLMELAKILCEEIEAQEGTE